jgi:hypothetical protein
MKLAFRLLTIVIVAAGALVVTTSPAAASPPCWISTNTPSTDTALVYWAAEVDCLNLYSIHIRTNLYKIVGSGDNQSYVWVDYSDRTQFGSWLYLPSSRWCNGNGSTTYIFNVFAYANGVAISPYPKWSSVSTLACGA